MKKPIIFCYFSDKGLNFVYQLFDNNGNVKSADNVFLLLTIYYSQIIIILKKNITWYWETIYKAVQGFIQAILMSSRQHKKTQSSNWVFKLNLHKVLFRSILVLNLHSNKISLQSFFYFKLFIFAPNVKRPIFFRDFTPWTVKFYFEVHLCWTFIQNKLGYKFSFLLSSFFILQM